MASLPGGGMEILMTSSLEDQRRKAQTRNEKKLKQVFFFSSQCCTHFITALKGSNESGSYECK